MDGNCQHLIARGGWAEAAILQRCTVPIEPRNTWSNGAYVLAALVLLIRGPWEEMFPLAGALVMLGVGSALYHATKRGWAQRLDNAGMYAVFTVLVIGGIIPEAPTVAVPLAAVAAGFLAWRYAFKVKVPLDDMMGLMLAIAALRPLAVHHSWIAVGSLGLFALGYVAWQLDKRHSRIVGLWGHAAWHCLTAGAITWLAVAQEVAR